MRRSEAHLPTVLAPLQPLEELAGPAEVVGEGEAGADRGHLPVLGDSRGIPSVQEQVLYMEFGVGQFNTLSMQRFKGQCRVS